MGTCISKTQERLAQGGQLQNMFQLWFTQALCAQAFALAGKYQQLAWHAD